MPKFSWTIFTISVATFIVFLSTVPLQLPPLNNVVLSVDKLAHCLAYFTLSTLLGLALELEWIIKKSKRIVFIAVFLFGLSLEYIKGYLFVYRAFEIYDLIANSVGILAFILFAKTIKKIVVKSCIFIN
ncbi:MAG: VanZ family protein [Flavobacteriaceae bacterium]